MLAVVAGLNFIGLRPVAVRGVVDQSVGRADKNHFGVVEGKAKRVGISLVNFEYKFAR